MDEHDEEDGGNWEWKLSPFELFKKKDEQFIFHEFISYNQTLALRDNCSNHLVGKGHLPCKCLSVLMEGDADCYYAAVAEYQMKRLISTLPCRFICSALWIHQTMTISLVIYSVREMARREATV